MANFAGRMDLFALVFIQLLAEAVSLSLSPALAGYLLDTEEKSGQEQIN